MSSQLRNVQLLLKTAALVSIAIAAVSSRLFSVIRFESIIHEFDPWANYRFTRYLVDHGFYKFLNFFDDRTWYPLGRVTGGTLYPGLMATSGAIHWLLHTKLGLPVNIRDICVLFAPAFSGLTALFTFLLTCEMKNETAGLLAAVFMGIMPGYTSRSVAGSYDNEAIAITLLMCTFYFWIRALKQGSGFWGALTAITYFYMVSAWGGYVFITNMIPLHVFVLIAMGRYSNRMYVAYSSWYALGTLASMQIPFVGFLPIKSSEHMAALGVFGLVQLVGFAEYVRARVPARQFKTVVIGAIVLILAVATAGLVGLTYTGVIAPWTGRFYSLWDTSYAKIHIPIIASVSEHQPTTWTSFYFDNSVLIWLFPAGVYMVMQELRDEHVFVVVYAMMASYFAGVMVRLMLALTPIICVAGAIALSTLFDVYGEFPWPIKSANKNKKGPKETKDTKDKTLSLFAAIRSKNIIEVPFARGVVMLAFIGYLWLLVRHAIWVTSNAYSSPSVVLSSVTPDGSQFLIDDFREAYYWLRMNTAEDARIMSWWDYGYQIGGMADRTTLVDNNTWNNTHIATVGKAMSSSEEVAYPILRQHDVDYVLIIFGGLIGFSSDDINKFLWMVRIAEGLWPDEVSERAFFTPAGEYRVDQQATEVMKNSLMYKMSYYRFPEAYGPRGQGPDRVRNQMIPASPDLNILEEAYTSENWLVRIYKVKSEDQVGRDLTKIKKKATKQRPQVELRL